eukprot:Awhi_evm1s12118
MEKDIFEVNQRHQLLVKEFVEGKIKLTPETNREKNNLGVNNTLNDTFGQEREIDDLSSSTVGGSVPTDIIIKDNNKRTRESANFSSTQETIISDKQSVQENGETNTIGNTNVIISNTDLEDETPVVVNCGVHNSGDRNELLEEPHQAGSKITGYTDIEDLRVDGELP